MKIVVTLPAGTVREIFFPPDIVKKLGSVATVVWNDIGEKLEGEKLIEYIKDADVCMTGWGSARFERQILDNAPKLKVIAHTGGSIANIVSDSIYERGITVISGNRLYAESVAEGALAYILCALRRIPLYCGMLQNGQWASLDSRNEGLLDQTVGLVGFGAVSRYLVGMLAPFKVKIRVYDPYVSREVLNKYGVEQSELNDVFSKSKIISVHAAMTSDTYRMIGKEQLEYVQDGVLLVNTARAGIFDEAALADALQKQRFFAVLDVFDEEPLIPESKLKGLSNVILMPHMAGPTMDRKRLVTLSLIDDIQKIFSGETPENIIERSYAMSMTRSDYKVIPCEVEPEKI